MNIHSKTEVRELPSGGWNVVQPVDALVEPIASGSFAIGLFVTPDHRLAESIALRLNFLRGYSDEELIKQGGLQQALDKQYAEGKVFGYGQATTWIEEFDV